MQARWRVRLLAGLTVPLALAVGVQCLRGRQLADQHLGGGR